MVDPQAFTESIKVRGLGGPKGVKLLHQHENEWVIGRITRLEAKDDGVWIEATIDEDISRGKDVAAMVKANDGLSFSVGFYPIDLDILEVGGTEILYISKGDLFEVSVCTFPAQENAIMEGSE